MNEKSVGGSKLIVGLQESEISAKKWIVDVRNPKFSEEVPALLDDVVGFIAEYIVEYCDSMSIVVWSDDRCDGMILCGYPSTEMERHGTIGQSLNGKQQRQARTGCLLILKVTLKVKFMVF